MTEKEMALLIIGELRKQAPPSYVDIHTEPEDTTIMLDGYFDILKVADVIMEKVSEYVDETRREAAWEEVDWC